MVKQHTSTKNDILSALERLLKDKDYADIGIMEICEEAHISKPTFYRHFKNKDDIVHWTTLEVIRCGIAQVGRRYGWHEAAYRTSAALYQHRILYCGPRSSTHIAELVATGSDYLKHAFITTLTKYKGIDLTAMLLFEIDAFNYVYGYMAQKWAEEGMPHHPKNYASYLTRTVPIDLFWLLNDPSEINGWGGDA